jgi:hypothetical protein
VTRPSIHHGASQAAGSDAATRLARLVSKHALPERAGAPDSTKRMLDAVAALLSGIGSNYDAAKVVTWVRRFPLRSAEQPADGWQDLPDAERTAIAEAVLMHGGHPAVVANAYATTHATVLAIVDQYRTRIHRSKGQGNA